MIKYDKIAQTFDSILDCYVNFKEFSIDYLGNKNPILELEGFKAIKLIQENEFLDKDDIFRYYGSDVDPIFYHYQPYLRLVVERPAKFKTRERILHLNKAFFIQGLQEIDLYQKEPELQTVGGIKKWRS